MAKLLGADLHELTHPGKRLRRYAALAIDTLKLISTTKPDIIFFQNPSLLLATLVALSRKFLFRNTKIVGDYHNAGVSPPITPWLTRWVAKNADLVLVSNASLVKEVTSWGASAIAIPDPLPDIPHQDKASPRQNTGKFTLLFICSWADDEPVANVADAARQLMDEGVLVEIKITGRPKWELRCGNRPIPGNVILTGFLSDAEFDRELRNSDAVIDLTTRENCMVCGAYEAVATERPMILSGNEATKQYFYQGAIFTDNSTTCIKSCILHMMDDHPTLSNEVRELKGQLSAKQDDLIGELAARIGLNNSTPEAVSPVNSQG